MAIGTTAALVLGGSALASSAIGAIGAGKASRAQQEGAQAAIGEQRRQYDLSRKDLAPWRKAGGKAINAGLAMLQPDYDHTTGPGYQFRFDEGMRGIENSAAARGMLMSGGTLKDLTRFGQGVASADFNDQFNRNMAIAGGGQQATTSLASLGANAATNIGNAQMQGANARASGYMGTANAISGGLNNLASLALMGGGGGGGANSYGVFGAGNIY